MPALTSVRNTNPVWTNYLHSFKQSESVFSTAFVYPDVPVSTQTFTYYKIADASFLGSGSVQPSAGYGERAPGGSFVRLPNLSTSTGTGKVVEHGFESTLDDRVAQYSELPVGLERTLVDRLRMTHLIARDVRTAAVVFNTSSITTGNTTLSGANQWSDDTSDPIGDVETGKEALLTQVGYDPAIHELCALTNDQVARTLAWHPQLASVMPDNQMKKASPEWLAAAFNLDAVHVAKSVRNTAKLGQSASVARIWGDDFLLFIKPRGSTLSSTGLGFRAVFEDDSVETYREDATKSTVFRVCGVGDELLTHEAAAYLIKDCLA